MTTANQLVQVALSEIGYTESPTNSNKTKFAAEAGHANGAFWCATYTTAIMKRCKVPIPAGAGTASTRANMAAWKKAGQWVSKSEIQAGDVIFFHTSDRNGKDPNVPSHTGFAVTKPSKGRQPSVDGNTASDDAGDQENGGGVFTKNRVQSVVIGAGRPDYQGDDMADGFTDGDRATLNATRAATAQLVNADGRLVELLNAIKEAVDSDDHGGPGQITPEVIDKIAQAVTDEQADRLKD